MSTELQTVLNSTNTVAPTEKRRGRIPSADSKIAKAVEIYKNNSNLRRKEIIELFMKQLGMTEAGAATYYVIARKKLGVSKPAQAKH